MRDFALDQVARHDADDLAAGVEHALGEGAHQPRVAAAVHDAPLGAREQRAERPRRFGVARVGAGARGAEDADGGKHGGR